MGKNDRNARPRRRRLARRADRGASAAPIGWDAVVFERNAEELASRGVGLGTHQQLIEILKRAGIDFDKSMGIKPTRAICLDWAARF